MNNSKLKSTENAAEHRKKIQQLTDTEEISAVGMLVINSGLHTNVFKIGSYLSVEHSPENAIVLPGLKTRPVEQPICPKIHSVLCFLMYQYF